MNTLTVERKAELILELQYRAKRQRTEEAAAWMASLPEHEREYLHQTLTEASRVIGVAVDTFFTDLGRLLGKVAKDLTPILKQINAELAKQSTN